MDDKFLFITFVYSCVTFVLIHAHFKTFTGQANHYFENPNSTLVTRSDIQCCLICNSDEGCTAINYNRQTSECQILTNYSDDTGSLVVKKNWTLYREAVGCDQGWIPYEDACYKLFQQRRRWLHAGGVCRHYNAELVDIHSAEENAFVFNMSNFNGVFPVWIGLTDMFSATNFRWSSRVPISYLNFSPFQPDGIFFKECVSNSITSTQWNEDTCSNTYGYICEKPKA